MDAPLPPSLLTRLSEDMASANRSVATADLPTSAASMRLYAHRKLLTMTPRALSTLDSLLDADPKIALGAATKILDKSLATRDDPANQSLATEALPPAALEALSSALASFASAAAATLTAAAATPAPSPITVEVLDAD